QMRTRIVVGVIGVMALAGAATLAARGTDLVGADKQWSIVTFADRVRVASAVVMGPVLIVHDSNKMARGEACTTFYRFKPGKGPTDEIVSFPCPPRQATLAETTMVTAVSR